MPIQAPQWSDYLNCPVCCREFGAPPRSPVSLGCGHTICRQCLSHLHKKPCPFDQNVIQVDEEEVVVNTAVLQLAGLSPPPQPRRPPSVRALPEPDQRAYDAIVRSMEQLATHLKYSNSIAGGGRGRLSRPMQRKIVNLIQSCLADEAGRARAARAARSLVERSVTELILQHQNPQQLSANLWAAVRARGCQFLGPAMQEEVLKLVLLALEDGSALSRKVLVMFVVQRLEPHFPQASKTSIGHVVQLLYRASCFKVSKRECDSSLMQLKAEFRTYEALRREHDAQIVQIATEAGLRIAPDQWSALLYGDGAHKSHMQSIIDKLQSPQSFAQSVQELFIALQRTGDPSHLLDVTAHLDRLADVDATSDVRSHSWQCLSTLISTLCEVVTALVRHQLPPDHNHNDAAPSDAAATGGGPAAAGAAPPAPAARRKLVVCRDAAAHAVCPRGTACPYAHSQEELDIFRNRQPTLNAPGEAAASNGGGQDHGFAYYYQPTPEPMQAPMFPPPMQNYNLPSNLYQRYAVQPPPGFSPMQEPPISSAGAASSSQPPPGAYPFGRPPPPAHHVVDYPVIIDGRRQIRADRDVFAGDAFARAPPPAWVRALPPPPRLQPRPDLSFNFTDMGQALPNLPGPSQSSGELWTATYKSNAENYPDNAFSFGDMRQELAAMGARPPPPEELEEELNELERRFAADLNK